VEKNQAEKNLNRKTAQAPTAGERAAKAVMAAIGSVKELLASFRRARLGAQVIHHHGTALVSVGQVAFTRILVVEDNAQTARSIVYTIKQYYTFGEVSICLATCFRTALSFFAVQDIQLVIMDSDLHDEQGDGIALTEKFVVQKPGVVILANSSSRMANMKMESCGASESISKKEAKLRSWLLANDPVGSNG
jgi:CheY-like chemotaxis protein